MDPSSKSACVQLVQDVADHYWKHWAAEVTPIQVIRQQWHAQKRNLNVGDLVLVHDSNKLRNKYKLAIVTDVHVSQDGLVRSCTVGFRQSRSPTKRMKYRSVWQSLQRSVQRLTLLLPVEEQEESIEVTDGIIARVQTGDEGRTMDGESRQEICPDQQDDDKEESSEENGHAKNGDSGIVSEKIDSILSPSAAPFYPREMGDQQERKKVLDEKIKVPLNLGLEDDANRTRAKTEEEKLGNDPDENCHEVPSTEDVEANANISPEVELMNTSSNGNETRYNEDDRFPLEDEACAQEKKAKVGRLRKGTIIASRRSARAQAREQACT